MEAAPGFKWIISARVDFKLAIKECKLLEQITGLDNKHNSKFYTASFNLKVNECLKLQARRMKIAELSLTTEDGKEVQMTAHALEKF